MTETLDVHKKAYQEEAAELLADLESALLELETSADDPELIARIFRVMHTIKGSGAMFGFNDVAYLTHEAESIFDHIKNGKIAVTKDLINLSLKTCDCVRSLVGISSSRAGEEEIENIVASLRTYMPEKVKKSTASKPQKIFAGEVEEKTYRIRFCPARELFKTGTNPLSLLRELKGLGPCTITAHEDAIPPIGEIDPEKCYVFWDLILTTNKGMEAVRDVFIFVEDSAEIRIDTIDEHGGDDIAAQYKRLGEILVERGDVKKEEVEKIIQDKKPIGELLVEAGIVGPSRIESALVEQEHVRNIREKRQREEALTSVKVPAEKLDSLVDLVGEMVTVQARLSQKAARSSDPEYLHIAEQVERLTAELRDNAMSMRMLPIGTTYGRFRRLVRDLSQELGKEIELIEEGAETELDKTVIEKLNDPLVHLIRNAIDHGIEAPHVRLAAGKPAMGKLRLSAVHSGSNVLIEIGDDGAGLNREGIFRKAVERGLAAPSAELTDKEIFNFIFTPGFSTAAEVTNVSGRGVGMDVVKKAIDGLRGSVEIDSRYGAGTVITIRLPLTLVIVEGLLVRIDASSFVLPLSIVEECVELTREDSGKSHGRNIANIRGELVPYIRLRDEFRISGKSPDIEQIVITGSNGGRMGFVVDHVIGEHQTVIKNLGRFYRGVEGVSGATILGDGTVALIVDTQKVIKNMNAAERC